MGSSWQVGGSYVFDNALPSILGYKCKLLLYTVHVQSNQPLHTPWLGRRTQDLSSQMYNDTLLLRIPHDHYKVMGKYLQKQNKHMKNTYLAVRAQGVVEGGFMGVPGGELGG